MPAAGRPPKSFLLFTGRTREVHCECELGWRSSLLRSPDCFLAFFRTAEGMRYIEQRVVAVQTFALAFGRAVRWVQVDLGELVPLVRRRMRKPICFMPA